MLRDIGLSVSDGWALACAGAVGMYLVFLMYRANFRGANRYLLVIRAAALLLLIGLLMQPILALTLHTQRRPLIALLIDDSESMQIADGDTARFEIANAVLDHPALKALGHRARVSQFRFSDALSPMRDGEAPTWGGRATDLAGALDGVREQTMGEGLAAVVLVSDGGQNLGGRPERAAEEIGVPVIAIGIGDPVAPKDVGIASAVIDPMGYVGKPLALRVRAFSFGFDRVRERVRVLFEGGEIAAKTIALTDGEQTVDFEIAPQRAGRHAFSISIAAQAGERAEANNRVVVSTEVLESRVRILILAGSPSADLGYLRRVLQSDDNMEVEVLVRALATGWATEVQRAMKTLNDRDVVALINAPYDALAGMPEREIVSFVQRGGGLLVIGGDAAFDDGYARSALADVLPVRVLAAPSAFREGAFALAFPDSRHPILRVSDDPLTDREAWDALPPLLSYNRVGAAVSNATVLAHHPTERADGDPMPLLAIRRVEAGKTAMVGFQTFWRHGLMMWGDGKTDAVARAFWKNVTRWLVTRDDMSRIKLTTEKTAYRSGEAVVVHARVFDALLQPRSGARVRAQVADGSGMREVALRDLGNGRYAGNLGRFPQGDYEYRVAAGDLGTGTGHFTVGRYSLEYETVRMRAEMLGDIATRSGGQYARPSGLAAALDSVVLAPEPVVTHHRIGLWGQQWPLLALVGLLVIEWAVRRRLGMV